MSEVSRINIERSYFTGAVAVYLSDTDQKTRHELVATEIIMKPIDLGDLVAPSFTVPTAAMQALMNELWVAGFRPAENLNSTQGKVETMQAHLNDLRTLLFKKSGIGGAG